jgi:isopentenyl diphosphate isomerase/L-lactate dehydrogenase-like FMN-dependent dehydrogenase
VIRGDILLPAPIGGLEALAEGGGISVARAAASFNVPFLLSSVSEAGMQTVSEAANGTKIFQLYTRGDAAWVDGQIRQAMDLGYDAFCITVESAIYSRREGPGHARRVPRQHSYLARSSV